MDLDTLIIEDNGKEVERKIEFTFESEDYGKKYVFYYDPADDETILCASYDDEGNLYEIEDPEEWKMVQEVFEVFQDDEEEQ